MDDVNIHIDELVLDDTGFDDHRAARQIRDLVGGLLPSQHAALISRAIVDAVQDRMHLPSLGG